MIIVIASKASNQLRFKLGYIFLCYRPIIFPNSNTLLSNIKLDLNLSTTLIAEAKKVWHVYTPRMNM